MYIEIKINAESLPGMQMKAIIIKSSELKLKFVLGPENERSIVTNTLYQNVIRK